MEEYRNCPICLEVPEKEVYQCSAGHIVCNVCIEKLIECPQCRVNYGVPRTRSRVLEALLDTQEFECKFKEDGCPYICKRNNISIHSNSCDFNPGLIPLCELLGWQECKFRIGSCSKNDVIKHFEEIHKKFYEVQGDFNISGASIKALFSESTPVQFSDPRALLCGLADDDYSPLFLFTAKMSDSSSFLSFICIQLCGLEKSEKYCVRFSLKQGLTSPSTFSNETPAIDPLLISWTMNVCTIRDAEYALKKCPIGVYAPVLEDFRFGEKSDDVLHVNIFVTT